MLSKEVAMKTKHTERYTPRHPLAGKITKGFRVSNEKMDSRMEAAKQC